MNLARSIFQNLPISSSGYIVGVAVFDLSGLVQDYFMAESDLGTAWIQATFQSLSLKSLLASYFQFPGFEQATIYAAGYRVVVARYKDSYIGLLSRQVSTEQVVNTLSQLATQPNT